MQKRRVKYYQLSYVGMSCLLLLVFIFAACSSSNGSTNKDNSSSATKSPGSSSSTDVSVNVTADAVTPPTKVTLGSQPCPAVVSAPSYWDPIIGTQSGVSAVSRVTCANLVGNPTLQALILVGYQGTGNVADVYVYDKITDPHPQQLFKLQNLYKGDARISGYNTILTAEVDQNSSVNKNAGGAQQLDLFREFKWSDGAGTFTPVPFPGLFPVLTRYQAETDQQQVNQGHQPWQLSASMTAQALAANLLKWAPGASATIIQGGGQQDLNAVVDVKSPNPGGGTIRVSMSRLEGNRNGGIWIATGVTSQGLSITSPAANDRLTSPVNVAGTSTAFEGKAGTIHILDHTETDIGHADVQPSQGMGNVTYTATVSYNSTFKMGTQEGIVALYLLSNADGSIAAAVMVKVLLG
jgi:hypothetical protein